MSTGSRADELAKRHTAFPNFKALINAPGNYRPSLLITTARGLRGRQLRELADIYDTAQQERGDNRRAFRS